MKIENPERDVKIALTPRYISKVPSGLTHGLPHRMTHDNWKFAGEEDKWKSEPGPMSNYVASVKLNKRFPTLNPKHDKGREILLQPAKNADVV